MYNTAKKQVWFGELRTPRGNTVVIHDSQLPEASVGRIFLYNTVRKAIVEYVEEIVKPNLHDLEESEIKDAQSKYGSDWKAARDDFLSQRPSVKGVASIAPVAAKKTKQEQEPDDDEAFDDSDDFDDDWSNDFDNDDE